MNKRNIALVISMILVLLVSACTTYQPYEPTGEVVGEPEVVHQPRVDVGAVQLGEDQHVRRTLERAEAEQPLPLLHVDGV